VKRTRHIYLFSDEDIDNDDIIAEVENSPTFNRNKTNLNNIRNKSVQEEVEAPAEENLGGSDVITF
jgi:cell division protein FtsZ